MLYHPRPLRGSRPGHIGLPQLMPHLQVIVAISLLVVLPMLAGCGALLGQRYTNFTAFYNTFYNARQAFEREERAILRADEPVDRSFFLPVFVEPTQGRSGNQNLEGAIRRAADVLRDHPESRWVDDALLLIGKAYHYQGNYDAAAQKFREVLSLEHGRLVDEAYLWLGRALVGTTDYAAASSALREGLGRDGVHARWAGRMRLALGEAYVRQGDLEQAITELRNGLSAVDDHLLLARGHFLLGQALESTGRHAEAADAFQSSFQSRPTPEVEYAAELQRAIALSNAGNHDSALSLLDRMRRDDKYFQQRGEVELTRARALANAGEPGQARDLMRRLLYENDPNLRVDRVRGHLHYHLGAVYRDHLGNYPRAAAHFDTAATSLGGVVVAGREVRRTREAILDVERQAEDFGSYALIRGRVAEMDSLLYLGSLDDEAFTLAIEQIAAQRQEELLRQERERRRIEDQQGFGGMTGGVGQAQNGGVLGDGETTVTGASGFLGYQNPVRVQESLIAFQGRWGDRPHVPNWRRAAAVTLPTGLDDDFRQEFAIGDATTPPDVMMAALVDVGAVPRTTDARLQMRLERASARYELGNVLFLTLREPETAAEYYQQVLEEDPDAPVAPRALYALAEVYMALGDEARAAQIYEDIAERQDEARLSVAARERIGLPPLELPPDSARLADDAYADGFSAWQDRRHEEALRILLEVDERFRPSLAAARARLAAALVYTDWANGDTLLLLAAAPDSLAPDLEWELPPALESLQSEPDFLEQAQPELPSEPEGVEQESPEVIDGDFGDAAALDALRSDALLPEPEMPEEKMPEIDLLPVVLDTLGTPLFEPPDPADLPEPWLVLAYDSIVRDFPESAYADRAADLRAAISEVREAYIQSLAPDSIEIDPEDEPVIGEDAPPELATNGDVEMTYAGLRGDADIDLAAGGYTWKVLIAGSERMARNQMLALHNTGFRAAMTPLPESGRDHYAILVGQFPSENEADLASGGLPQGVDRNVLEIIPLEPSMTLVTASDLAIMGE